MRGLKIIGGIIAALVLLLVLGAVAIKWWVDPNDYRDDIERLVEQRTGRPLQIEGTIELTLFPWLAFTVRDVTLGNRPGFGDEPFLTAARASVGVRLLPLLRHRQLDVSRVALDGLAATLISRGEDNNWRDLAESEQAPSTPGERPQIAIAGVDITNSTIVYRDEVEGSVMRLSGLQLRTDAIEPDKPVRTTLQFAFDQGEPRPLANVQLETIVRLAQEAKRLELQNLDLRGTWFAAPDEQARTGEQEAPEGLPFTVATPAVALDLEAETLAPAEFEVRLGEMLVRLTASGEQLFGARQVTGKIAVPRISPRTVLPSFGIEVPETRDATVLTKATFDGDYRLAGNELRLDNILLVLDDTSVRGTAGLADLESRAIRFALAVDTIDIDRYLKPESEEESGNQDAEPQEEAPPTELPLDMLRKLEAKGELRLGQATLAEMEFSDVVLPLAAQGGIVRIGPTRARLLDGSYQGDIVLNARSRNAVLTLNERLRGIDVGALMSAMFETQRLVGRGDANATLTATGNDTAVLLKTLSGKIDANITGGAITGVDLWYELRRARALFEREPIPVRVGAARTEFDSFQGSATLDNGIMRSDDLRIETDYLRVRGAGTANLTSREIDFRLATTVYELPREGAGAEMAELRAAEIPISVTGTLEDMKIRPDLGAVVKARVRQEVEERVKDKVDDLKKKLGEKLGDILGR